MAPLSTSFSAFLVDRSAATSTIEPAIATPLCFTDARREHLATRRSAGLFDFSFMSCAQITGAGSVPFLNSLQTRSPGALPDGRIAYTLLLRDDGTVLSDATLWRLTHDCYWLFVGRRSDFGHISRCARQFDVGVIELAGQHAVMAIQGAASWRIIERCFAPRQLPALPYYGFQRIEFAGNACWLARIGYSGESGYELVIADTAAPALWQGLLAAGGDCGLLECGFAATDALRIEAGHILFTRELAAPVMPAELGLARLVDFYQPSFRGEPAVRAQRWQSPQRRLCGLLPAADYTGNAELPAQIRPGTAIMTSACRSPLFGRQIGLGFVNNEDAHPGAVVTLGDGTRARVARLPFYDPARCLPRRAR